MFSSSSLSSSLFRHSFTLEDFVPAPNLELGCAVILQNLLAIQSSLQLDTFTIQ